MFQEHIFRFLAAVAFGSEAAEVPLPGEEEEQGRAVGGAVR